MGAKLAICARDAEKLQQAAVDLQNRGTEVFSRVADVTDLADILMMVNETRAALGPVDILVNNAGIGHFGPFYELNEDDWDNTLDTNLKSVFMMSRAVAPEMIQRRIMNIYHQHRFAGWKICICGRRDLLRFKIRIDGPNRLHGRRFA